VIRSGKLYGRGSCDVKGFLACVLSAVSQVDVKRLVKPLAIVMTADEEIGCFGAKFLRGKKAFRSRYTIVGEPTGLRPVRAGKGYALGKIVVRGKEAHSAFPERGRSAIFDAARVLLRLERVAAKLKSRKNAAFDPPYTTLNVGLIEGGSAKNIVPGECRITVEWRPIPGQDSEWAPGLIRAEIEKLAGVDARFEVTRLDPAFDPAATKVLSSMFEGLSGKSSTTVSFGTEAPYLGGTEETIVFGAGDMTVAHRSGEFVPVKELEACTKYLKFAIEKICG
jgi:acetylornithine deacetylase